MASVRDYAILWRSGAGTAGGTAVGGNAITTTAPHRLDGPEHTAALDSTRLDASTDAHGLLPKLSGDAADALRGDGTWGAVAAVMALDDLSDVVITSPATVADRLRFDGSVWRNSALIWRPVMAYDGGTSNFLVITDGDGNALMAEG